MKLWPIIGQSRMHQSVIPDTGVERSHQKKKGANVLEFMRFKGEHQNKKAKAARGRPYSLIDT